MVSVLLTGTGWQPDGLAPEVAAMAADGLLTVYNAVHNVAGVSLSAFKSAVCLTDTDGC